MNPSDILPLATSSATTTIYKYPAVIEYGFYILLVEIVILALWKVWDIIRNRK